MLISVVEVSLKVIIQIKYPNIETLARISKKLTKKRQKNKLKRLKLGQVVPQV